MRQSFFISLLLVASLALGDTFTPIPKKIVGPGGSTVSVESGSVAIQPQTGGTVNVVSGTVYVPTVLDFSTTVSPTVSGAGHVSLVFNGTGILASINGAAYSAFGGSSWGGITGTLSAQTDVSTALNARLVIASNLSDLASASTARTNLGLGSLATQSITFGTGISTALAANVGSAGAPVLFNGAGGTPSSINLSNGTALPNASVTGLGALATVTPGTGVATAAAIAVNTAGGPLTHGGAGAHTTLTATGTTTLGASSGGTYVLTINSGSSNDCQIQCFGGDTYLDSRNHLYLRTGGIGGGTVLAVNNSPAGATISGTLSASGAVTFTGTTNSTSNTTGIVIIGNGSSGGLGVGQNIYAGNTIISPQFGGDGNLDQNWYGATIGGSNGNTQTVIAAKQVGTSSILYPVNFALYWRTNAGTAGWGPGHKYQAQTTNGTVVDFAHIQVPSTSVSNGAQTADYVIKVAQAGTVNEGLRVVGATLSTVHAGPSRLKGYTVSTLPTGTTGDTAYVTDALAPTFLATIVGGGAVVTPVFYNGTNWVGY